jgi:hypothetical protein
MTASPEWRLQGDWFDLCSCAIGCPCIFSSNPTQGFCDGALSWSIRQGHYGEVALDGLCFVAIVHFGGGTCSTGIGSLAGWSMSGPTPPSARR